MSQRRQPRDRFRLSHALLRLFFTRQFKEKPCSHRDQIDWDLTPGTNVCEDCVRLGDKWPDLRMLKNHTVLHSVELDLATDHWSLISGEFEPCKQPGAYDQACDWLRRNGQFPTVNSGQRS